MSFCRITGRSRGLPKPNYFPMLAPISPADAKRCCRITGKSYGLPSHHYIPVLLAGGSGKAKCKITNVSGELGPHHYTPEINYGNRIHTIIPDYRYIFPVLDGSTDAQKALVEMLMNKNVAEDKRYVYTVQERRCSLVFTAQMEAAVRDGDVRDVMLAKDSDTLLIKTKQGRNVSMEFKDFSEDVDMYEGEGPNTEVLKRREVEILEEKKRKRKRAAGLSNMKKIFENKEKLADVQELEEEKHRKDRIAKKAKLEELRLTKKDLITHHCENYDFQHMRSRSSIKMCSGDWRDLVQPLIESWDWDSFEKEEKKNDVVLIPKITTLPTPVRLESLQCDSDIYDVVDQSVGEFIAILESAPCVGILKPITRKPNQDLIDGVTLLTTEQLSDTANVHENITFDNNEHYLPDLKNVAKVVQNLQSGTKSRLSKIRGLMVDIGRAQTFVPGQYVKTPTGPMFVPGQTVLTPSGSVFMPGMSVNTPGGPAIIPGYVINSPSSEEPYFVAGQVLRTTNSEKFVQGQTVKCTDNSYRFVEGQTVASSEGIKFVPGKVMNTHEKQEFVPGQTIVTHDSIQFVPGQTITESDGEVFIPGQNVIIKDEWQFIPGQTVRNGNKDIFVPGATLHTPNGLKFVPGQTTMVDGQTVFVPGITRATENRLEFVPGTTVDTTEGLKFLEGQIISTPGYERFVAGRTLIKDNGQIAFSIAKNAEDIVFHEIAPMGLPIDIRTCSISEEFLYTFGHMVQTANGIQFYPGSLPPTIDGKIVPGRLIKNEISESRFVPGKMVEGIFVPGQTVFTENGEQFVPGQVIDTTDGPKFVPGQVVKTKSGPKFVPGQTIQTIDGPRFVPGQIIETKAGPTFIPGQVISTEEEGSRFVPGQVVDTEEGPRFVPGRVIESADHGVTFVPGQIVQTPEGLKFIAPDLTEGESGLEFSVQSFVVTPEELKLLKIKTNPNDTPSTRGELSIDTKMLRQLSEAGMAIGRQVPADLPAIDIVLNNAKNKEILISFVTDYGLKDGVANQLMAVITAIIEMSVHLKKQIDECNYPNTNNDENKRNRKMKKEISENDFGFHESDEKYHHHENIKNSIAAAVLAAMVISEQYQKVNMNYSKDKYHTILKSINTVLGKAIDESFVMVMYNILQSEDEKEDLCDQIIKHSSLPKVDLIKMALDNELQGKTISEESIIEKFTIFLSSENEVLGPAFKNITKANSELLRNVLSNISESVSFIATDDQATETLQKAIVAAVIKTSDTKLNEIISDPDKSELKILVQQSIGLAKILGMYDVVLKLGTVLNDSNCMSEIKKDETSMAILRRLTVMHQLAEKAPSMQSALRKLGTDVELVRTDPKLRDLVRESATLMFVPEEPPLLTSQDVPISLLQKENSLAMEDFLLQRRKHSGTLLIMKKGLQCVVPRESSRAVLTGQVAYTVLDENGIRHFEPLHVFTALQLNQPTTHRFSMYSCPVVEDIDIEPNSYTGYNANIIRDQRMTQIGGWRRYIRGILLDRENSTNRMSSLDYTPSYKRHSSLSRYSGNRIPAKVDDVVVATADYTATADDEVSLKAGDIVEVIDTNSSTGAKRRADPELDSCASSTLLDTSAARHKLAVRPRKNHPRGKTQKAEVNGSDNVERCLVRVLEDVDERVGGGAAGGRDVRVREGWVPASVLRDPEQESRVDAARDEAAFRRQAVVRELVETEEEFGRDLQQVVSRYMRPMDKARTPKVVFDNRELLFSNFRQIAEFHNTVLLEGIKYYAGDPRMLGRALLRMEREFDKHVAYCRDEPGAQHLIANDIAVNQYFQKLSDDLGDDKTISEHLKLPIQRINDYQLLLKELVKYSKRLGEDCTDLQKALELMLGVPHRATDNKFISSIEGYRGNIYKLGRLLTHDWFTVTDAEGKAKERYLFLFKARILVCKVRRISDDRSVFILKDIIKLPEVELKDHPANQFKFELHDPQIESYPITLSANKEHVKAAWLSEIRQHASDIVALAEHAADDLQVLYQVQSPPQVTTPEPPIKQQDENKTEEEVPCQIQDTSTERKSDILEPDIEVTTKEESIKQLQAKRKASFEKSAVKKQTKSAISEEDFNRGSIETSTFAGKVVTELKASESESIKSEIFVSEVKSSTKKSAKFIDDETAKSSVNTRQPAYAASGLVSESVIQEDVQAVTTEEAKGEDMSMRYTSRSTRRSEDYSSLSSTRKLSSSSKHESSSTYAAASETSSAALSTARCDSSSTAAAIVSGRRESSSASACARMESSFSSSSAIVNGSDAGVAGYVGTTRSIARSTSDAKPFFTKTLEGVNVEPGDKAEFQCKLRDAEGVKVTWLKDNKPMTDRLADRVVMSSEEGAHCLRLMHCRESDSGIYTARAENIFGNSHCTSQLVVQELTTEERKERNALKAPYFVVALKDTEIMENTYLRFMIKVKGDPNPAVKFYRNEAEISSGEERVKIVREFADNGFYELVIADVIPSDAGMYSCVAMNIYGDVKSEARVMVTDDKNIFGELPPGGEGLLTKGEKASFAWKRDGEPFDPEERFKVLLGDDEDSLALVFQHVRPEDAGLYTCVAKTSTGNISCSAELTVQGAVNQLVREPEKPKIVIEHREAVVSTGGSAMLELQCRGYPKPEVIWKHDGKVVEAGGRYKFLYEDSETMSLVIKSATTEDAGLYQISASNDLGADTTEMHLIVKAPPRIKKIENQTCMVSSNHTIIIEIEGTPEPDVTFYKDGVELKKSERINIVKESEVVYKITIGDTKLTDTGSYSVVAKNEVNQCSDFWQWHVTSPPKIVHKLGGNKECNEKETVVFQVKTEAEPAPTVKWFKDRAEITSESASVKISSSGESHSLTISSASRTDSGEYSCQLSNSHGTAGDSCDLSVRCSPMFTRKLQDKTAKEGDVNVEFTVNVQAYPEPSIKWYHGDIEITEKKSVFSRVDEGDMHKLILKEVAAEMSGVYSCKVSNELGAEASQATFTVHSKPRIMKSLVDMTVSEGQTLKLDVEVEGCPEPKIKWFKNGKEVTVDARVKIERDTKRLENYSLTVNLVKEEDGGEYEVTAENEMGSVSSKSTVTIHTKEVQSRFGKDTLEEKSIEDESQPKKLLGHEAQVDPKHEAGIDKTTADAIETYFWDHEEDSKAKTSKSEQVDISTQNSKNCVTEPEKLEEKYFWDDQRNDELNNVGIQDINTSKSKKASQSITDLEQTERLNFSDYKEDRLKKIEIEDVKDYISHKPIKSVTSTEELEGKSFWDDHTENMPKNYNNYISDESITQKGKQSVSEPEEIEIKSFLGEQDDKSLKKKNVVEMSQPSQKAHKYVTEPEKIYETFIWDDNDGFRSKEIAESVVHNPKRQTSPKSLSDPDIIEEIYQDNLNISKKKTPIGEELLKKSQSAETEAVPQVKDVKMSDGAVYESLPLQYSVRIEGAPQPVVKWTKDGAEVQPSSRIHLTSDAGLYRLHIDSVEMSDAGLYKVEVSNDLGNKVQKANLSVNSVNEFRKPIFTTPLEAQRVTQREPVAMKAVCTADPAPDVAWLHNGVELAPDSTLRLSHDVKDIEHGLKECTYNLSIPTGRHSDTGVYTIRAKNEYGIGESSARLDILLRPEIEGLKDVTAVPYEETHFVAVIHANPIAEVQWSKDGVIIQPSPTLDIVEDRSSESFKLILKKVTVGDAGVYTLIAKNEVGETAQQARLRVHTEGPEFVKKLEKQSVKDYDDCLLKVRCDGVPNPEVRWYYGDEEIKNDDRHTINTTVGGQVDSELEIKHFNSDDGGRYKVCALNPVGDTECSALISLAQTTPGFAHKLDRQCEIDEGEPLELKCKLNGSPIPKAKWYKDGTEIPADDSRIVLSSQPDGSIHLLIEKTTPSDCGAYKLVVSNPNGENSALCAVAINPTPRKPSISQELEDVNAIVGQPLKLEARVMAFPAPEIKWFKDGLPIRPSQAVNFVNQPGGIIGLSIDTCRPEDGGYYTLTVANKLGDITSKAEVIVEQQEKKPAFLAALQPTQVVEGFPAKMEVKVLGHPPPTIKWTHNGNEVVPDGKQIKLTLQPDGSQALIIDKATVRDAGEYAVVAVNDKGETSSKADLCVVGRCDDTLPQVRPQFVHGLRDVTVEEGTAITMTAPIVGNPVPDVMWSKDGKSLEPSDRVLLTFDGKRVGLHIKPAELSDASVYSCKLVNPLGEDDTSGKVIVRKVFQTPTFSQKFSDLQQLPTFDAKFPARVLGVPAPEIFWFRNDEAIHESNKYHLKRDGDACCLYVRDLVPEDSGNYKCLARNREGEASCEAVLEVVDKIERRQKMEPPAFLKKIGDTEVYRGMTAKFTACATGSPDPEVEWFRNGEKLYPSERIRMDKETTGLLRLSISGVEPSLDVGKYTCRIFNPHGEASCDAELSYDSLEPRQKKPLADQYTDFDKMKKTGVPMPLADRPIISRMTDRHLTLSWKPSIPHGPRVPVTYQVEMCELPDGDWFTARTGIRSCACDIRNLEPFRDYKFRIRVENKYGISDPSPFAITYRAKLEPDPPKFIPYLDPGIDFRPETSPYFPKDFDIERPPHDGYAQAPRFLRQEHDTQYGIKNHNSNLFWFVYGYPKPKMTYYFNEELIEPGGRYDWSYTRNGQATLFINKMLERDVGIYEAVATNEHGEARQRVRLDIAEYPQFIRRPEESVVMVRKTGRLEARVVGVPYPELKWYKDWKPLAPSSRIKIQFIEPDTSVLTINDAILKDEGLYSLSARNVAGSISSSAMLHVEEDEHEYDMYTYERMPHVKPSAKPFGDFYDLGDELGRGTQGVVYHAVERLTGRNYAAKIMHGHSELKPFMKNEMDIMNQLNDRKLIRLHDAYEHDHTLALVLELAAGGEVVRDHLLRNSTYTERDIAGFIRQTLYGLKYMHDRSIAHLGLTIGELLLSHSGSDDLKICDFGLSRRIAFGYKLANLDYGIPEYVAPEVANGEGVGFEADMWSLGIITYILLSGHSPFRGTNDRETLIRVREGKWDFHDEDWWSRISTEGRDFISKLLVYTTGPRMNIKMALDHPWLLRADKIYTDEYKISSDRLRNYYNVYRDWLSNASCRNWFRRRPLSGAFEHPSKMVYPPGHIYTPEGTPERSSRSPRKPGPWEINSNQWEHPDYEINAKSESHYQNGPDTYLLQLRDVDFPVRLREYMKVACNRSPGYSLTVNDTYDWRTPIIRERRRFTDIMDEEIDDERKERINNYGTENYTIRRLRHELGTRLDSYAEAEALIESKKDGRLPFFREKPQMLPIREDEPAELVCLAVGDPKPAVQWFKNDMVIAEGNRIKIVDDEEGRSILQFRPAMHHDIGIYKVVARNKVGQTVTRTRLVEATTPDAPDSPSTPEVSDTEILLRWKQPKYDGNSTVICYSLQYKEGDSVDWKVVAVNIDHEFYVVKNLKPKVSYQFRLASRNRIGWSEQGIPTKLILTKEEGASKLKITKAMRHLQLLTESGQEVVLDESRPKLNYSTENEPVEWDSSISLTESYSFISELWRGKFSIIVKGVDKTNDTVIVSKILENRPETEEQIKREFECLRRLRHERIANLIAAYKTPGSPVAAFIMEKLQGADILTYLSSRHDYTEQMVATIVTQVLDGLQYLHWRGYCHLDLQPDNIVMASVRSIQVKLVDFGSAFKVTKLGTTVPSQIGELDYKAPEIINDEPAFPQSDIWSLGVITYIMLSGVSPFKGADDGETKCNISFVRYRFEHLYKELSQEGTRFLMLVFKKAPQKRPLVEECYDHRWLMQSDFMIKKRERAVFLGNRLKEFSEEYHAKKAREASNTDTLNNAFGSQTPRQLTRSNSIQEELLTSF